MAWVFFLQPKHIKKNRATITCSIEPEEQNLPQKTAAMINLNNGKISTKLSTTHDQLIQLIH
ncbi:MAG: hypothetical protein VX542_00925, partial [Cyanobacteriota bacterium]|nr:hypothetical protein [Cyanobacteriota bacterium]